MTFAIETLFWSVKLDSVTAARVVYTVSRTATAARADTQNIDCQKSISTFLCYLVATTDETDAADQEDHEETLPLDLLLEVLNTLRWT